MEMKTRSRELVNSDCRRRPRPPTEAAANNPGSEPRASKKQRGAASSADRRPPVPRSWRSRSGAPRIPTAGFPRIYTVVNTLRRRGSDRRFSGEQDARGGSHATMIHATATPRAELR